MNRTIRLWLGVLGTLLLADAGLCQAAACKDTIDSTATVLADGFTANQSNTRNNASNITSSNVATLQLNWANAAEASGKRGAVAVTTQAVFFAAGRDLVAMNRTGTCRYWTYTVPAKASNSSLSGNNLLRAASVYYLAPQSSGQHARIYAGDQNGVMYSVDAADGTLLWSAFVGTDPLHHFLTGGFQYQAGNFIVPIASNEVLTAPTEVKPCCSSHGMLRAINADTGAVVWTYDTTADASWQSDIGKFAPNGSSVWSTPAIDVARNAVYIGTGQNYTPPTTHNSDSVVALDLSTGREKWVFQATANDAWNAGCELPTPFDGDCVLPAGSDYDFGASPILATLPGGGQAVIAGAKNGIVYSLNPDTGVMNWSTRVGAGGNLGGVHWGMAMDSTHVYAAVSDVLVNKLSGLSLFGLLSLNKHIADFMVQSNNATPGVYALNLANGSVAWAYHGQHSYQGQSYDSIYSAALTVSNDLVFAGSLDGTLVALRSSDGKALWSYDSAHSFVDSERKRGNGGTIDSVGAVLAGSDLFLNSGYNQFGNANAYQAGPGNALFVLSLPGN